ncbi:MAG: HigA family addiction module antidote protein [Rhizobiales bacterium]|nr:HigA family addiction module antidote protein [Hyphomicrobiales bacterium]
MAKKLDPIPPGEILIEEFMKPLGVSPNRLARDIDIPVSRVSEIVRGRRSITADTALRLGEYFGTSPEFWLNLQTGFDLRRVRATAWETIRKRIRPLQAA